MEAIYVKTILNQPVSKFSAKMWVNLRLSKGAIDGLESQALTECRAQLYTEYAEAIGMISTGCAMVSISDRLRRSLARVANEVQSAINDGAILTVDDLAMLCAAEAKKIGDEFEGETDKTQSDYARTLFVFTGQ